MSDAREAYRLARSKWETGDLAGAEQEYRNAIDSDPGFALAHYDLASMKERSDPEQAAGSYRQFIAKAAGQSALAELVAQAADRLEVLAGPADVAHETPKSSNEEASVADGEPTVPSGPWYMTVRVWAAAALAAVTAMDFLAWGYQGGQRGWAYTASDYSVGKLFRFSDIGGSDLVNTLDALLPYQGVFIGIAGLVLVASATGRLRLASWASWLGAIVIVGIAAWHMSHGFLEATSAPGPWLTAALGIGMLIPRRIGGGVVDDT